MLKVPSGAMWQVELFKSDDEAWFQNGWQEFADYYCLEHGDLLVFEYEGNSQFTVIIFDPSATEIEYPIFSTRDGKFLEPKEEETQDGMSAEFLGDFFPKPKKRGKSPLPCSASQPNKVRRTYVTRSVGRTSKLNTLVPPNGTDQFSKVTKKGSKREIILDCSAPQFEGI